MLYRLYRIWSVVVALSVVCATVADGQDFYYDLESTWSVSPSETKIVVQFDSTQAELQQAEFLARHACLDAGATVTYLHRGFSVFAISLGCSYAQAEASLITDSVVYRALPVYVVDADGAEFKAGGPDVRPGFTGSHSYKSKSPSSLMLALGNPTLPGIQL